MKKINFALILALVFALSVPAARAQAQDTSGGLSPAARTQLEAQKEALEAFKARVEAEGGATKEAIEAFKSDIDARRAEFQTQREAFLKELEVKKREFRAQIEADRAAFKARLEAERAKVAEEIKEQKEKRAEFRGRAKEVMSGRFDAAVKNIKNLQSKVEARISALKAAGADTAQAEVYLADSKTKLADAEAKIAEIKALVPTTDEKVTIEVWEEIKQGAHDAKNLIKESHKSLVEAVKIMKGLGEKVRKDKEADDDDSDNGDGNGSSEE